jgi:exosome complex RNA-binding protein Rrp4
MLTFGENQTIPINPNMSSDCLLPGQPVPLPRGPTLQLGTGLYTINGEIRASLLGTPLQHGSVRLFPFRV